MSSEDQTAGEQPAPNRFDRQQGDGAPAPLRIAATAAERPCALPLVPGGGVTTPRGFKAAGVHAGFRKDPGRLDLALVVADEPCACAAWTASSPTTPSEATALAT